MKEYRDTGRDIKEYNIRVGDRVLLKRKSTKQNGVYDQQPSKVVEKYGTQIGVERRQEEGEGCSNMEEGESDTETEIWTKDREVKISGVSGHRSRDAGSGTGNQSGSSKR